MLDNGSNKFKEDNINYSGVWGIIHKALFVESMMFKGWGGKIFTLKGQDNYKVVDLLSTIYEFFIILNFNVGVGFAKLLT